jgi:NADH-quinone oxidoreductase subunit G
MTDTIRFTIDDRSLSAPAGTLIVDAAKKAGITIPVFCYHPLLSSVGMCRMCLVEVGTPSVDRETGQVQRDENDEPVIRWYPTLQTACTMPVSEGMVVRTETERVARARKDIIEFFLTSHPLDCPICDKGGECPLQNQTMDFGVGVSRFDYDAKQRLDKHVPLGELIYLDRERCIQCGRCIRFQDEIADDPVLSFANRGRRLEIVNFSDPPFDSYFGGNTTDICPVGALTTADFRFGARPWELQRRASLCNHCPVGCNITLDTRVEGRSGGWVIKRVMPRQNQHVNDIWICDKGRYGHHHARAEGRLKTPLVRKNGELIEATWEEALDLVVRRIKRTPSEQIAGVAGDRLSNEDLFAFQKLMRDVVGTPHIDAYPKAPGADLVATHGIGSETDWKQIGSNSVIIVVAGDLEEQAPIWFLQVKAAAERGAHLITINGRKTRLDRYAKKRLRIKYGSAPHLLLGLTRLVLTDHVAIDGTEQLQESLSGFGSAATERLTGVAAKELERIAQILLHAEDAMVIFGREGLNDYGALALVGAAANLLTVTGHFGRANNGLLPLWPHNNTQGAIDMGVRPNGGPGYQQILEHGWDYDSMLAAAAHGSISFVWFAGVDPMSDHPELEQTLDTLDFVVVQELFLTQTARKADVVLPALSFAERDGTYTSGDRRVQRFDRALPPLGGGRPDWAILAEVAKRLGTDWGFDSTATILKSINENVPLYAHITLGALRATEDQWPPVGSDSLYFAGTAYQNDGGLGVRWPTFAESQDVDVGFSLPEAATLHDVELVSVPVRRLYGEGTLINCSDVLEQRLRGQIAEFNPRDAERIALEAGSVVKARVSGRGFDLIAEIHEDVPDGVVLVPGHLPAGPISVTMPETTHLSG